MEITAEIEDMWCGENWHHFGHYWTDHDGVEWYCDNGTD